MGRRNPFLLYYLGEKMKAKYVGKDGKMAIIAKRHPSGKGWKPFVLGATPRVITKEEFEKAQKKYGKEIVEV